MSSFFISRVSCDPFILVYGRFSKIKAVSVKTHLKTSLQSSVVIFCTALTRVIVQNKQRHVMILRLLSKIVTDRK